MTHTLLQMNRDRKYQMPGIKLQAHKSVKDLDILFAFSFPFSKQLQTVIAIYMKSIDIKLSIYWTDNYAT